MARTSLKNWIKPVVRRDRPPVMIGHAEVKNALPTMIVTLNQCENGAFRNFKKFCKRDGHPIGWEELDHGIYVVCGLPDDLNGPHGLTSRFFVRDWWWDHTTRVVGGSGHGERPKRKELTMAQIKELDRYSKSKMKKVR